MANILALQILYIQVCPVITYDMPLIDRKSRLAMANALYTVRQLHELERRSLLTQPAANQLFRAALTQLAVGYAMVVLLLPVLS